jgi:hypothetical protein
LTNVDFVEQPLKDVFLFLQDVHKIPIHIRKNKLDEVGIPLDKPVTISLRGVSLRTALDLILDELELTYFVKEVLIVTTPEDAENNLETRVYDLRDLLAMPAPDVPQSSRSRATGTATAPMPTTAPGTRTTTPDPFAPRPAAPIGSVGEGGTGGGIIGAAPGRRAGATEGLGAGPAQRQPQTELEKRTTDLIELITATVKPDTWDDVGGPGAIDAYNGLFVVSQTAKVHEQVEQVLDMLRKAAGLEAAKGAKVVR